MVYTGDRSTTRSSKLFIGRGLSWETVSIDVKVRGTDFSVFVTFGTESRGRP